jgi:hypothetical protein
VKAHEQQRFQSWCRSPAKIKYSERHALDGTRRPSATWVMIGTEMLEQADACATRVETLLQCSKVLCEEIDHKQYGVCS